MRRRELFSAFFKKREERLHPPYYEEIEAFEKCKECEEKPCVTSCEEGIIIVVDQKPSLDFSKGGCTFCDACAKACGEVLKVDAKRALPKVAIDPLTCLAWHQTICSSCKDACLDRAIDFLGLFHPQVNERCIGCGFCVGVCPSGAIGVKG